MASTAARNELAVSAPVVRGNSARSDVVEAMGLINLVEKASIGKSSTRTTGWQTDLM
jgi:hypothetical protein